ncbi:hypothetical protein [Pyrinomonas methylaliphatogenes]|jgi:hypothetical protein|uniref:Uncharacterized protein n=1 Tax=Pyrinomonas methylaliphatogenes TaxID=454194 RepID=A0A0B6WTA2_9BACT|nr:hypothetical protein [Pyrinomonas methylaliphatogenes]CDM64246.1 hypothetical protein PYK22_00239 [Pyrinomonas methylaliphatogenes]
MRRRIAFFPLCLISLLLSPVGSAQRSASSSVSDPLLAALPASDAIMFVDAQRLLNEALPRLYANDTAKLNQINSELDQFKSRTGIDPRSFERIAIGANFTSAPSGATKVEPAVLARGRFNAGAMIAAGRIAAKGKYREERYGGRSIYIFTPDEQVKLLGLLPAKLGEIAVTEFDAHTLALGTPARVRALLDAQKGRNRVNNDLVALAARNANAIIGFGGTVPPAIFDADIMGNDEVANAIRAVKQFYGSISTTARGFELLLTARSQSPENAKYLGDTIVAVKQIGGALASQLPGNRGRLAQIALNNLSIATQGDEVLLRLELAQTEMAELMRGL